MKEVKVILSAEEANQILNYLATKPYIEVAKLIQILQAGVKNDENEVPKIGT